MGNADPTAASAIQVDSVTVGWFSMDMYETTFEMWTEVLTLGHSAGYPDVSRGVNGVTPKSNTCLLAGT